MLDLMGSWSSHLPDNLELEGLTVLGMNQDELQQNSRATDTLMQDLNIKPLLPFEGASFDAVIDWWQTCSTWVAVLPASPLCHTGGIPAHRTIPTKTSGSAIRSIWFGDIAHRKKEMYILERKQLEAASMEQVWAFLQNPLRGTSHRMKEH